MQESWEPEAAAMLIHALEPSTQRGYDGALRRLQAFVNGKGRPLFYPDDTPVLLASDFAAFLEHDTRGSTRPQSRIKQASAAVSALFRGRDSPSHDDYIVMLKAALIKRRTTAPMKHSVPLELGVVLEMFRGWGPTANLSLPKLRVKALCLLAYALALRPSDATNPKASSIRVAEGGAAVTLTFLGTKTDRARIGDVVTLDAASDPEVCPVATLASYMDATTDTRSDMDAGIFLAITPPFDPIGSKRLAVLMKETAISAGAPPDITAKSFRSGAATTAMNRGVDEEIAMRAGRWRTVEVFRRHYVQRGLPGNYTDRVLGLVDEDVEDEDEGSDAASDDDSSTCSGPSLRPSATRG